MSQPIGDSQVEHMDTGGGIIGSEEKNGNIMDSTQSAPTSEEKSSEEVSEKQVEKEGTEKTKVPEAGKVPEGKNATKKDNGTNQEAVEQAQDKSLMVDGSGKVEQFLEVTDVTQEMTTDVQQTSPTESSESRDKTDKSTTAGQSDSSPTKSAPPAEKSTDNSNSSPTKTATGKSGTSPTKTATGKSGTSPTKTVSDKIDTSPTKSATSPTKSASGKSDASPTKSATGKSDSSPTKSATSPTKSTTSTNRSPNKSATSPTKSAASPTKSATSLDTSTKDTPSNLSEAGSEENDDENKKGVLDRSVIVEGKRKRHSVERMVIGQDTGARKAKPMERGKGTELGEIPYVKKVLEKTASVEMQGLYRICFGKVGKKATLKRELREFNGFAFGESDPEFVKRKNIANKFTAAQLKDIATMLGIERALKKDSLIDNIMTFVHNPKDLGKSPEALSRRKKGAKKRKSSSKKAEKGAAKEPKAKKARKAKVVAESSDEKEDDSSDEEEEDSDQEESGNEEKDSSSPRKDSKKEADSKTNDKKPWGVDGPSDQDVTNEINMLLHAMDLSQATMKEMCVEIAKKFPKLDMNKHKTELKQRIKAALDQLDP